MYIRGDKVKKMVRKKGTVKDYGPDNGEHQTIGF